MSTRTELRPTTTEGRVPDPTAAPALLLGTLACLAAMAHHPTSGGSAAADTASLLGELAREAPLGAAVHGVAIASLVVLFHGLLGLSAWLGWERPGVRAAALAHGLGVVFFAGAATINGFVVPRVAAAHASGVAPPAERLEALRVLLRFAWEANQALAQAGTLASSVALLAWSLVLARRSGLARVLGAWGALVAVVPALAVATGGLRLHLHGMAAVLAAQATWWLGVALLLRRARRSAARPLRSP